MTFGCRHIQKTLESRIEFACDVQVCFFINFSSFKPDNSLFAPLTVHDECKPTYSNFQ